MGAEFSKMMTDCAPVFDTKWYSNLETPETVIEDVMNGVDLMGHQQHTQEENAVRAKVRAFRYKQLGNKSAALVAMKESHQYSNLAAQISRQKMVLEQVRSHMETAVVNKDIAGVLAKCTVAISGMMKGVDVTDVDKMMETLQNQSESIAEISEAVSSPLVVDNIEDPILTEEDLWAELEDMDEPPPELAPLDENAFIPPTPTPSPYIHTGLGTTDNNNNTLRVLETAPSPPESLLGDQIPRGGERTARRSVDTRRTPAGSTRGRAGGFPTRSRHPNRLRPRQDETHRNGGMGKMYVASGEDRQGAPVGVQTRGQIPRVEYSELELT